MNRKVAIGCAAIFVVIAVAIGIAVSMAPKLFKKGAAFVGGMIAEQQRIGAFEGKWNPPSATPDVKWFPKEFGDWKLLSTEPSTALSQLRIERPGTHAVYQSGQESVGVDVVAANDLEREALFTRVREALGSGGGSRMSTHFGNRLYVRINNNEHTRLWWLKNWLFIFRSRGSADPELFAQQYLDAMQPTPVEAPAK